MQKFTTRLILNLSIVIFAVFISIYTVFNTVSQNFIHNHVRDEFTLDFLRQIEESVVLIYNREFWKGLTIHETSSIFFDLPYGIDIFYSFPLSIMSDPTIKNYIILNHRNEFASPALSNRELIWIDDIQVFRNVFLADYYLGNQEQFSNGNIERVEVGGNIYYMQQITVEHFDDIYNRFGEAIILSPSTRMLPQNHTLSSPYQIRPEITHYPYTVLLFSDVTSIVNFKDTINQILLIALISSGFLILIMAISLSAKFNTSIKKLSKYAKEIGFGKFNTPPPKLKYKEFNYLADDMNTMSEMLNVAEENQKSFFQNASHEFRTPLMAIQCYTEGILSGIFSPDEAANIIKSETEKMSELVTSVLYLSRLDNNKSTSLNLIPTSVDVLLESCCKQIKIIAKKNGKMICYNPTDKDVQINTDIKLFERAIINILTNAIRYASRQITITFQIENGEIVIRIKNDGPSIEEKDLPHIFSRFYKGSGGNTGIGLAITQDIIERLGGNITANNLADGVVFIINIKT